ncbi:hypothetical protein MCOR21_010576 [Pyricularia oryzae]|nr:hypothetical protein MCOR01_002417 [Pyricularia oryzae]KAI6418930.1 hypothetical protein MCOR21_010576 [Pyricularia oryzae]
MGLFDKFAFAKRHERTPEERAYVRKLDICLMTFGCISQIMKYLDQTNINNAYVSGMKEDLQLYGDELNYFTTFFLLGNLIMVVPSQIALTYIPPNWWLPGLEITWGVLTGLFAVTKNARDIYALRFFLGMCESSAWPGMMTMMIYWYTPSEIAKRMGIYQCSQAVGSMMSGALAISVVKTMDGKGGLAAWRWLFIVECLMTVVVGCFGFLMVPGLPHKLNPWAFWFKESDAKLAMKRLHRHGKQEPVKITLKTIKRSLASPLFYAIVPLSMGANMANYGMYYFGVFLKSLKNADGTPRWNVTEVNGIPIGGSGVSIVALLIFTNLSDLFQSRWTIFMAQAIIGLFATIYMTVWTAHPDTTPIGGAYASYFMLYMTIGVTLIVTAWLSDLLPHDPDSVTFIIGATVALNFAILSWAQALMWPASKAPYYVHGWGSSIGIWLFCMLMVAAVWYIDRRYLKAKRQAFRETLINTDVEESDKVGPASRQDEGEPELADKGPAIPQAAEAKQTV